MLLILLTLKNKNMFIKLKETRIKYDEVLSYSPLKNCQILVQTVKNKIFKDFIIDCDNVDERNKLLRRLDVFVGVQCC